MRIVKVKWKEKENRLAIKYALPNENQSGEDEDCWDEYSITFKKASPRPELVKCFTNLRAGALELCELTNTFKLENVTVTGVSFSYGGDQGVMGAVLTFSIKIETANSPLNLNSPHKPSDSYNEEEPRPYECLDFPTVRALEQLVEETQLYLKGERAQQALDLEPKEELQETLV